MLQVLPTLLLAAALAFQVALPVAAGESAPVVTKRSTATLITEADSVAPGGRTRVALRLRMAEGWHTYWRNPGEAGIPPELAVTLSPGAAAGAIEWPTPSRLMEGTITTYGYTGEVVLPLAVTAAPGTGGAGGAVTGRVQANWLICKDICVPEEASFPLDLPAGTGAPSTEAALFQAHDRVTPHPSPWRATIAPDGTLSVRGEELTQATVADATFIPEEPGQVIDAAAQRLAFGEGGLTLALRLAKGFPVDDAGLRGVLSVRDRGGARTDVALAALAAPGGAASAATVAASMIPAGSTLVGSTPTVSTPRGEAPTGGTPTQPAPPVSVSGVTAPVGAIPGGTASVGTTPVGTNAANAVFGGGTPAPEVPLARALVFAFLGGLILNLMPCVFPILAMKAVGFASGLSRGTARAHALAYTSGVLATFGGLAVALLLAREAGGAAGWGFQFASPAFVAAMAWLLFAVGLNLSGVFRVGGGFAGAGGSLAAREGHWGSFFTGALAVLVATPCTAPFMGVAIAAGLAAPPWVTVLVFLVMGLGLAAPYLLLAASPFLGRLMPRPGRWMEVFRQLLAFPMYGAAVWLLWVIGQEAGNPGVLVTAAGFVLLGFAGWSLGITQDASPSGRRLGWAGAAVALALAVGALPGLRLSPLATAAGGDAEAFSPARLAALRTEGRPVFVNLTAAWCVTCLVNERVAIGGDTVRRAFADSNVAYLKGDWTRQDPAITGFLRQHGRDGVPLYLYYAPHAVEPAVLPQLLTEGLVLAALKGAS